MVREILHVMLSNMAFIVPKAYIIRSIIESTSKTNIVSIRR